MKAEPETIDLVWGARNIAKVLGITERACFHMLEKGELPGTRQVGQRWVASYKRLREHFEGETPQ